MSGPIDPTKVVTHSDPVWRAQSNYLLMADLAEYNAAGRYEQMWLTDLGEDRYRLCCLPLFTYGYSLGDVIEAKTVAGHRVLGRVIEPSGRALIRAIFHGHGPDHEAVHAAIVESHSLAEWRGDDYVSIDVPTTMPPALAAVLARLHGAGALQWENAGSRDIQ